LEVEHLAGSAENGAMMPEPMQVAPVTLGGRVVRLEPITREHIPALCEVGLDADIWRWYAQAIRTAEDMAGAVETALKEQAQGVTLPFVIIGAASGRVVGSTRYLNVDRTHHRLEIGWTWLARPWRRTAINTEAKYLLLRHAFETLHCIRVELKTDSLNEPSRTAILRIGAREEGTFRNHMITESGRLRHSVYYSIIEAEWPAVKTRLERLLGAPGTTAPDGHDHPSSRAESAA
jgi:RimJ/RimL family protein N-acetyltransferase